MQQILRSLRTFIHRNAYVYVTRIFIERDAISYLRGDKSEVRLVRETERNLGDRAILGIAVIVIR